MPANPPRRPLAPRALPALSAVLVRALRWAPVWVPLLLLWQVAFRGLRPALAEQARLEQEAVAVRERYDGARARFERMEAELRATADPIYRERLRRLIRASDGRLAGR